jgi:hypothetical protein
MHAQLDVKRDMATVTVPRGCLRYPQWVRVAASSYHFDGARRQPVRPPGPPRLIGGARTPHVVERRRPFSNDPFAARLLRSHVLRHPQRLPTLT